MHSIPVDEYLASCCKIASDAGAIIMTYFAREFNARKKDDHSPVTDADVAANTYIVEQLRKLAPAIPIIAEEDEAMGATTHELFWLVDPLDGTRAFVAGEPEFTVNIGLIYKNRPVMGVIYAPPQQEMYFAADGKGAFKSVSGERPKAIHVRKPARDGIVVVRSKSHPSPRTAEYLSRYTVKDMIPGSSSIKFCTVAEGKADLYPRLGRTMEWDTAAGHAILNAAGGRVETIEGKSLEYGKAGFENPHFVAFGDLD